MNAARLSSVTDWTVVQLRDPGQMHTSTNDWRYTRAAPQVIVAPAGSFQPYTVAINPTGALEMHQKNEAFKSIEELRIVSAFARLTTLFGSATARLAISRFTVMDHIRAESPIPFEPSGRIAD
jgi:hypothetical protein